MLRLQVNVPEGPYPAPFATIYRGMALIGTEGVGALPKYCGVLMLAFFLGGKQGWLLLRLWPFLPLSIVHLTMQELDDCAHAPVSGFLLPVFGLPFLDLPFPLCAHLRDVNGQPPLGRGGGGRGTSVCVWGRGFHACVCVFACVFACVLCLHNFASENCGQLVLHLPCKPVFHLHTEDP